MPRRLFRASRPAPIVLVGYVPADWAEQPRRWPNFPRDELACKCGCGRAAMDARFMDYLQWLRWELGAALVVNSGDRCPEHNAKVSSSGSRDGPHTTGKAADLKVAYGLADDLLWLTYQPSPSGLTVWGRGFCQRGDRRLRYMHIDFVPRALHWSY